MVRFGFCGIFRVVLLFYNVGGDWCEDFSIVFNAVEKIDFWLMCVDEMSFGSVDFDFNFRLLDMI